MKYMVKQAKVGMHWFLICERSNVFWMFDGCVPVNLRNFIKEHNAMVDRGITSITDGNQIAMYIQREMGHFGMKYDLGDSAEHAENMRKWTEQRQAPIALLNKQKGELSFGDLGKLLARNIITREEYEKHPNSQIPEPVLQMSEKDIRTYCDKAGIDYDKLQVVDDNHGA